MGRDGFQSRGSKQKLSLILMVFFFIFFAALSIKLLTNRPDRSIGSENEIDIEVNNIEDDDSDVIAVTTFEALPWSREEIEAILGLDDGDWHNYSDLEQEKTAIGETINGFVEALAKKDVEGSVNQIFTERQGAYGDLFSSNPEAMVGFSQLVSKAEMSFLSEDYDPAFTTFQRTAEYSVKIDDFTFYLVFIKENDQWLLYDF